MIANWKPASELPEERIRVIARDSLKFIQIGFYGESLKDETKLWRAADWHDSCIEEAIDIVEWDYLPE